VPPPTPAADPGSPAAEGAPGSPVPGQPAPGTGGPAAEVGVGPWPGPWPDDPRYDPALLRDGDRRNVVDRYRYWTVQAVRADLDTCRHPFHVAVENWAHDLNIGSVVRSANAFNAAGVHIVGRRRWNRRGAMVTDAYLDVHHHPDVDALLAWAEDAGLPVLGIDNLPGSVPLETYPLPRGCVLLFGQEGPGLSEAAHRRCAAVLSIAQFGSTRSLNAGAAAAIAMHAWIRAHAGNPAGTGASPGPPGRSGHSGEARRTG
jgi:tRNA(Leu) C34 or U34 (ribose-2'-O)-methylase TrmL